MMNWICKWSLLTPIAVACLTVTGLVACQRPLEPQTSCQFLQNGSKQRVSWKNGLPVSLFVHSSVPEEAYPALEQAIESYNLKFGKEVFKVKGYGTTGPSTPKRDGYSIIYWMDQWESDRSNEQGRTTVYWSGNSIYEADMRINASGRIRFHFSPTQNPIYGVDLKSLFVHELGHVLGLDHNQVAGSIMHTYLQEGTNRDELSPEDIANLSCEYGYGS